MGCCGDEDDEILNHLIPDEEDPVAGTLKSRRNIAGGPEDSGTGGIFSDAFIVISPLNSNFSALISRDILCSIFERLPLPPVEFHRVRPRDASQGLQVAVEAQGCGREPVVRELLARQWSGSVRHLAPPRPRRHRCWPRCEVFCAVAFIPLHDDPDRSSIRPTAEDLNCKIFTHQMVMDIKRLNNMMSDHGIHSRERLLIPISKPDILLDGTCYIELDAYAKREVAVMYPEGAPDGKVNYLANRMTGRGKRRILDSMRRSMRVDDGTAEYYLSISNGDPRAAFSEFSEDLRWEQQARAP